MALEIVVTTERWKNDPASRSFVDFVRDKQDELHLTNAVLYYDFPAYVDYETATSRPDVLIFSDRHGFVAIRFVDPSLFQRSDESIAEIDSSLGDFSSNLYSRLLRSRELRKSRTKAIVDVSPVIFLTGSASPPNTQLQAEVDSEVCGSFESFSNYLQTLLSDPLQPTLTEEVRSVVEGAKALTRPQKRIIDNPAEQPLAVAISSLEAQIANFDEKQRHIALVDVGGPARIRGLAGSGKTVILAMKAAHLHLNKPDARILITFHTKSLRATLKNLITRFYRHYSELDPNWKNVHVRYSWGGATTPGVYSEACKRSNTIPLKLPEAMRLAKPNENPLEAACAHLLSQTTVEPFYDYVLIDEGQDLPSSFYRLCYLLAKGPRDRKNIVWAYDELQDIMKVKIRQPSELFGKNGDGIARIDLDRSSQHLPPGATNDAVLEKCYRNQRDILVTAHALGFGVYGTIVQLLESRAHWQDVGYDVLTGELVTGEPVSVVRPDRNSPLPVPKVQGFPLLSWHLADEFDDEIEWVADQVRRFLANGLSPEDVVIIALDDRNARSYLSRISEQLSFLRISSNNIIADPYNEPPFSISGKVTLSTVYRAKGNEAAAVIAVGVDAVETRSRNGRNKLFTAFTRSKAWLRVSGLRPNAERIFGELETALSNAPEIHFTMPDLKEIETIQRGFSKKQALAKKAREEFLKKLRDAGFSEDEIEEEIQSKLNS
jgi:superfamily I DNA and RNA helicase